jgi:hypothetical protein
MSRRTSHFGLTGYRLFLGFAGWAALGGHAGAQSPFGLNDPTQRVTDTINSIQRNMIGRDRAVSSEIVHNTPEILDAVYQNIYWSNLARLNSVQLAGNGPAPGEDAVQSRAEQFFLNNLAQEAQLAKATQRHILRFNAESGSSGLGGALPGADLLSQSAMIRVPIHEGNNRIRWETRQVPTIQFVTPSAPASNSPFSPDGTGGFASPAAFAQGDSTGTVTTLVVPNGGYGYGIAPTYGPR